MFAIIECLEDYSTKGERYIEEDIFRWCLEDSFFWQGRDILKKIYSAYLSKIYSTEVEIIQEKVYLYLIKGGKIFRQAYLSEGEIFYLRGRDMKNDITLGRET